MKYVVTWDVLTIGGLHRVILLNNTTNKHWIFDSKDDAENIAKEFETTEINVQVLPVEETKNEMTP